MKQKPGHQTGNIQLVPGTIFRGKETTKYPRLLSSHLEGVRWYLSNSRATENLLLLLLKSLFTESCRSYFILFTTKLNLTPEDVKTAGDSGLEEGKHQLFLPSQDMRWGLENKLNNGSLEEAQIHLQLSANRSIRFHWGNGKMLHNNDVFLFNNWRWKKVIININLLVPENTWLQWLPQSSANLYSFLLFFAFFK